MNQHKWKSNPALKAALAAVSILAAAVAIGCFFAAAMMKDIGVYSQPKEEVLKKKYNNYTDIYLAMAMWSREVPESEGMKKHIDQTNFRYGIIKAEDINQVDISDPASYAYYNFEEMPTKEEIESGDARFDAIAADAVSGYSFYESLFGHGRIIYEEQPQLMAIPEETAAETQVLITGYYYNVDDGVFYYATEGDFYRVDEVALPVGAGNEMLSFRYDSGQHAYYNANPEASPVKEYYLTFDQFDGTEVSWQTWSSVYLDNEIFERKNIRFVNDENTWTGEFLGKPIANHYYKFYRRGLLGAVEGTGASVTAGTVAAEMPETKEMPMSAEIPATDEAAAAEMPAIDAGIPGIKEEADAAAVEKAAEAAAEGTKSETFLVVSKVRNPLQKTGLQLPHSILPGDLYEQITVVIDYAYAWRYTIFVVFAVALVLWGSSTVLVLIAAGHRGAKTAADVDDAEINEVKERWVDAVKPGFWQKMPLDVETCMIGSLGLIAMICAEVFSGDYWNIGIPLLFTAYYILCFIWLTDFAVRLKLGKWWRGMLAYKCFAWMGRYVKKCVRFLRENIPFLWKGILILGGVSFLEFFGIVVTRNDVDVEFTIWLFYRGFTVVLILLGLVQANRLREGAKKLAAGNLQEKIGTERMFWEFKKHGEDLNSIGDGINLAVEKRMQSEHFRTELITNVSHDIKTPLTSIINYVDLLQKEQIDNEKAKEYLEVLSRQSARLKKLTEDLIEASKASTGSMAVHMERLELGVFLTQTVGEFEERLTAAGLRIVMRRAEREVFVEADGRHLWRVVENLVQNICKYAQPDTRVYIDLDETEREAVISFKNVSRYELNISGAELMERFVRGDSSRHTDGSGLGLSIAGSLMELMRGKLEIVVDGDLFKVVLRFPK